MSRLSVNRRNALLAGAGMAIPTTGGLSPVLAQGVPDPGTNPSQVAVAFTPAQLAERTKYRRAIEAAIWGMPIVVADAIRQGFLGLGAKYNDIAYFSKFADWKFQTTTPNASTYYFYSAYSTKDGPVVMEVPAAVGAGIYGQFNDIWVSTAARPSISRTNRLTSSAASSGVSPSR